MAKMIEPNYVHYTRIKSISATDAQWLLAIFELIQVDSFRKEIIQQKRPSVFAIEFDLYCHSRNVLPHERDHCGEKDSQQNCHDYNDDNPQRDYPLVDPAQFLKHRNIILGRLS